MKEPTVANGFHVDVLTGIDFGSLAQVCLGFIVHDDHIQHAADCVARGIGSHAGRCCEVHEIGIGLCNLIIAAVRLKALQLTDKGIGPVVVGNGRRIQAHACLGRADGKGAANQTGIGVGLRVDRNVPGHIDLAVVTDHRLHQVGEVSHGDGACNGCLTARGRGRNNAARNGFHIVVGRSQEVHQIDGIQNILGGDVDGNGVRRRRAVLVQIQNTLIAGRRGRTAVGHAGIRNQGGDAVGQAKVAHIHTELLRLHRQALAFDGRIAADCGNNIILAINGCDACAHTDCAAGADADSTCTDGQLGLIRCAEGDILCRSNGFSLKAFLIECCFRRSLGHQNGNGTADGSLAADAGNTASHRLGAQCAPVLIVHILGQLCFDGHITGVLGVNGIARVTDMIGIGDNAAADVGDRPIVVDTDGNSGCNGRKRAAHGHRGAGTSGAEVTVVVGKDADGTGGHVAGDGIDRLMVGNVQSDCRGNLN